MVMNNGEMGASSSSRLGGSLRGRLVAPLAGATLALALAGLIAPIDLLQVVVKDDKESA